MSDLDNVCPSPTTRFDQFKFGRLPIGKVAPVIEHGAYPAKAVEGEQFPISARIYREGHDKVGATVVLTAPDGQQSHVDMVQIWPEGLDIWQAWVRLDTTGDWTFRIEAWADDWHTWHHNADIKLAAGMDLELVCAEGHDLFVDALSRARSAGADAEAVVIEAADAGLKPSRPFAELHRVAMATDLDAAMTRFGRRRLTTPTVDYPIQVDRKRALYASWYEFFPRSQGATRDPQTGQWRSGTFNDCYPMLEHIAEMGFDVAYVPPIHPVGRQFRKGPNNSLVAGPDDPGSPWAVGGPEGGHDAIHPDLGTIEDFDAFVAKAHSLGLEVALDFALQASPDHPWVTEHPEWFTTRLDGTIAYAENPPKKYQDIYPLNFDTDPAGIYAEMLRVVRHWVAQGVKIFRVDNPHTKPLQFWEWLIATVNADDPDVIFLSEAFTRPAIMQSLAMAGFQQSYSYFTWRNTKAELEEFLQSISDETADFMRPNLFVNTHDILTEYLQYGGRPAYKIRAAIAATAGATYGVYAGYELYENVARPGSEENIDNEKYEFKFRDWDQAEADGDSLAPFLRRLNEIRRAHPALRQLRGLTVHWSDDDAILVYSKHIDGALTDTGVSDTIIVVANVDPRSVRQTTVHLDSTVWGVPRGEEFEVEDLITGAVWTWNQDAFVRLDAFAEPVHILHVKERS